jgi:hypothetical protein
MASQSKHTSDNDQEINAFDTEDQLSLAVEVAAVNQAILALSGQPQPDNRNLRVKEEGDSS